MRRLAAAFLSLLLALTPSLLQAAESLRIATFGYPFSREGPGLLLRDILAGKDPDLRRAEAAILKARPDILLLTDFDYDYRLIALSALAARLREGGLDYPHLFAFRPNSGMASGADLDRDGRLGTPRDALGYGRFAGDGGMALLSRYPILQEEARDFSALLWRDLPEADLPPWPPERRNPAADAVQRLSSRGHWDVPIAALSGGRPLHVLAWSATAPLFDGPEKANLRRNADEARFWLLLLDGALEWTPPPAPFVLMGNANLDPENGAGRHEAIRRLLADPRLQDPGPPAPTAIWPRKSSGGTQGPLRLRVDYALPSTDLDVIGSGLLWPEAPPGSRNRALLWVDLRR
ncbi:MAG TPA: endonuclease/exonuclease/phosphatase family protein [Aliiroseovarius sp.]|nr:endonuclease/exonuclease/phosphatase family protein [Aliiroseovarius sp.]